MRRFLMDFFSPERSLIRYIVGTAVLTVLIQFFYDLSKDNLGPWGAALLAVLLIFILLGILWLDFRRVRQQIFARPQEKPISPHRGLILLISPGKKDPPLGAIAHHLASLECCWLISSLGSLATARELAIEILARKPGITICDVNETIVDPESIVSAYDLVNRIYEKMPVQLGLAETDIVADITGGQKPMTAGMALACFSPNRKMQYLKVVRDKNGDPIPGASPVPVLIDNVPAETLAAPLS